MNLFANFIANSPIEMMKNRQAFLSLHRTKENPYGKRKRHNRIKVVLVEKKRTNKWLAKQLEKDPATVSKWCTNTSQPSLETLLRISQILEVDIRELLISSKQ